MDVSLAKSAAAELAEYLQAAYIQDTPLETEAINRWLSQIPLGSFDWSCGVDDDMPPLHCACMNEATEPAELFSAVTKLLEHGADPQVKDTDGDTALQAVLSLATQDEEPDQEALQAHFAVVRALINCPKQELGNSELQALCSWLRNHVPQGGQNQVLAELERRVGREATAGAWASEMFLKYLEQSAYEAKRGLQASVVQQYLAAGATPSISQNGASALLLMVLNPYSSYEEMITICRMVLEKDPRVVCQRDGFKLTPLDWASDYENIAVQHGVKPNPASLLALLPALIELAPDMADDSGARCLKVSATGITGEARPEVPLRFLEGDRVRCRVEAPGGKTAWEEGVIVALWYREPCWPRSFPGAPYQVKLDIGQLVYALSDHDVMVQREAKAEKASSAGAPKATRGRFCKQQKEDGSWELLDTKSGKARACSPPDSDED